MSAMQPRQSEAEAARKAVDAAYDEWAAATHARLEAERTEADAKARYLNRMRDYERLRSGQ